jgi:vacuolar-type H+-ATPase subunit E/Vma4
LPDAANVLGNLIAEALAALPEGSVRVHLPADFAALVDAPAWQRLAAGRWKIEPCADSNAAAGVVVESADGRQRFDNTFEGRLRRNYEPLRQVIAEVLFGS